MLTLLSILVAFGYLALIAGIVIAVILLVMWLDAKLVDWLLR